MGVRAPAGFSLIEVLISIVVLAIGLLGLGAVFPVVVAQQREVSDTVQGISLERSVADYLAGHWLLNEASKVNVNSGAIETGGRRGWAVLTADRNWSPPLAEPKFPDGDWVLTNPATDLFSITGGIGMDPARGDMLVGPANADPSRTLYLPVTERLVPAPYSSDADPRFVWDFVARRVEAGDGHVNGETATEGQRRAEDDQVQVAVFVRRIDSGIRVQQNMVLADVLTGNGRAADEQSLRRVPVGADQYGRPTLDGMGEPGRNYSQIQSIAYEFVPGQGNERYQRDRIIIDPRDDNERLQPFARQIGQQLVDQWGEVHTVKGFEEENDAYIITPPVTSRAVSYLDTSNLPLRMVFTPQVPASVAVVTVRR